MTTSRVTGARYGWEIEGKTKELLCVYYENYIQFTNHSYFFWIFNLLFLPKSMGNKQSHRIWFII